MGYKYDALCQPESYSKPQTLTQPRRKKAGGKDITTGLDDYGDDDWRQNKGCSKGCLIGFVGIMGLAAYISYRAGLFDYIQAYFNK